MILTLTQQQAVTSTHPFTFTIAGPGSGKTRTLIARILYLLKTGVEPAHIVAITFTNAAAREIETRLVESGFLASLGYVGTLHSFMLLLMRRYGDVIGYRGGRVTVIDNERAAEFLADVITEQNWKGSGKAITAAIRHGPPRCIGCQQPREAIVAAAYWAKLRAARLITFDGLLIIGERLLELLRKSGTAIQYSHYLIDEVQDSSDRDFRIYNLFTGDRYMVGDPDQSIYSFRGGDVSHCLKVLHDGEAHAVVLEENFRSDRAICRTANRLIAYNSERWPKETAPVSSDEGFVGASEYESAPVEASALSMAIMRHQHEGTLFREMAVLLRTNDLVQEYANYLRALSIPIASSRMPQRPVDWPFVMATLSFMQNPDDDYAAYRWYYLTKGKEFADALRLRALQSYLTMNGADRNRPPATLEDVPTLAASASPESAALITNAMAQLEPDHDTIADLIIELGRDEESIEGDREGLTVSTIHAAKGREWDVVFLPAFEQHTIPGTRVHSNLEEERRLAYVAVTRARHHLQVSWCKRRVLKWSSSPGPTDVTVSQFVQEMGL